MVNRDIHFKNFLQLSDKLVASGSVIFVGVCERGGGRERKEGEEGEREEG